MTDAIHITPARPADLPDLLRLIRALSAFHGDTARVTLEQLQDMIFGARPQVDAFVARQAGQIVGYAGLTSDVVVHEASLRMDIHHLYVVETHRGRGIGRALIAAARDLATARGAERLTIGTDPRNASAIAAYRAMSGLQEMTDPGPRFRVLLDAADDR